MRKKARFVRFSSVGPGAQEQLIDFCKREPRTVIQFIGKLWPFYLKNFIPDRVIGGHSEYVRFVIVGRSRTGSNFLRGSLMSHGRIIVFGNIFREYNAIHWGIPFYPQSKSMLSLIQNDPVRFLETRVFRKFPRCVSAVGFKTLYPHTSNESWKSVQTYLGSQKTFRIIHIKRRNILKTYLSQKRVTQTKGRWSNLSGVEEENPPIFLDYEGCLKAFTGTREWEREYDTFFKDHHKLDVLYENLSSDYESEMKRIQEFLGVDYQVVRPLTYKQIHQPLSRAISNYFELKERFRGTSWEEFFED